ncbi:MAG: hypothetical protein AABY09_05775, partial [Nanoarchaeota archaeon]
SKGHTVFRGINQINNSNGAQCHTFKVPYCSKSDLKKGDEIFLRGLKEIRFREHLWYFINSPNSKPLDPLEGWK